MIERRATLRAKLLRWLLIPLSLLFLLDAAGSFFMAKRLSERVYDGELMEIARELGLHVRDSGGKPASIWRRTPSARSCSTSTTRSTTPCAVPPANGSPATPSCSRRSVRRPRRLLRRRDARRHRSGSRSCAPAADSAVVQVAETLVKRRALAQEIFIDVILPQLLLILIAGCWCGWALRAAFLRCASAAGGGGALAPRLEPGRRRPTSPPKCIRCCRRSTI